MTINDGRVSVVQVGEQGPPGAQGPAGPQGPEGPEGPAGSGGSAAGADGQIQFALSGGFSADAGLAYNSTTKALTVGGATVTTDSPVLDLAQTWNSGATVFTGLKLNITDTASAATSLLLDVQVGGVSAFRVNKSMQFLIDQDVVKQRRGVNPQALEIYNKYTSDSDYERGYMRWSGNQLTIGNEQDGTGAGRTFELSSSGALWLRSAGGQEYRFYVGTVHMFRLSKTFNSFFPATDIAYDMGLPSFRFRDMYVGRNVFFDGLPTADPAVVGQLWNNAGVVTVSAG